MGGAAGRVITPHVPEERKLAMFEVLEVSLTAIEAMREPVRRIRSVDVDLWRQVRRAASSVALNVAEGNRRVGRDRQHAFRVAAGSADEVRVALRAAVAWGDLQPAAVQQPLELLDRVLAMLWKLTR